MKQFSRPWLASTLACGLGVGTWSQTYPCPAWTTEGEQDGAAYGTAVASAGDVNGDGFDDVLVGAPFTRTGRGLRVAPTCTSARQPACPRARLGP